MPSLRYMLRPAKFLTTPKKLAELTGVEKIYRYPGRRGTSYPLFDPDQDFIMAWPDPSMFVVPDEEIQFWCKFYTSDKKKQREMIGQLGLAIPESYSASQYVKRPLRHHGGAGFSIVAQADVPENDPEHYYTPLFERTHEYRVILCRGHPTALMAKTLPEGGLPQTVPWNHEAGCRFVTIQRENSILQRYTSFYGRFDSIVNSKLATPHLLGIDVMVNKATYRYAVSEINFAPGITVENNLQAVADWMLSEDGMTLPEGGPSPMAQELEARREELEYEDDEESYDEDGDIYPEDEEY